MFQNTRILSECHYDSTTPILNFSQARIRTYLTTHEERRKKKEISIIYFLFLLSKL